MTFVETILNLGSSPNPGAFLTAAKYFNSNSIIFKITEAIGASLNQFHLSVEAWHIPATFL
jgi:hypothetical protein